ncbi:MAG: hypothetical protein R6V77_02520 [Candidatus Cloacimonadaceae bacterium]
MKEYKEPIAVAFLPDHPTPCSVRSHVHDAVPFVIYKPGETPDSVEKYDEESCQKGSIGYLENGEFIRELFGLR